MTNRVASRPQAPGTQQEDAPRRVRPSEPPSGVPLVLRAFGATDKGLVRKKNEDQFVVATMTGALWVHRSTIPQAAVQYGDARGHLLVVADGMGGHAGGEEASALAVGAAEQFILGTLGWLFALKEPRTGILDELKDALRSADATVSEQAAARPDLHDMGTTLTLAYSVGTTLYVAHAGDSRCYLFRQGRLHQVTRDHSVVNELVEAGVIDASQGERNQWRHVVTNVVGGGKPGTSAEVHRLEFAPNDVVMLCTDGLYEMVKGERIAEVLATELEPQQACQRWSGTPSTRAARTTSRSSSRATTRTSRAPPPPRIDGRRDVVGSARAPDPRVPPRVRALRHGERRARRLVRRRARGARG